MLASLSFFIIISLIISFAVDNANSVVEISLRGNAQIFQNSGSSFGASRVVVDSAGTQQIFKYGGAPSSATSSANPFTGGNIIALTGLSAGTHTVKTQIISGTAGTVFLRANSQPNQEFLTTTVVEMKK